MSKFEVVWNSEVAFDGCRGGESWWSEHRTIRFFWTAVFSLALVVSAGCFSSGTMGRTGVGGLAVGDEAPAIDIQRIVHGTPMDMTSNKVKVIEFWATWCGPCLAGMPHLSELQTRYGDEVMILGITSEDSSTVQGFLASEAGNGKTWADVVKYRMAIDNQDATSTAYMRAAGVSSIPTAFIIGKDGTLKWIGHPSSMDGPLKAAVEGD